MSSGKWPIFCFGLSVLSLWYVPNTITQPDISEIIKAPAQHGTPLSDIIITFNVCHKWKVNFMHEFVIISASVTTYITPIKHNFLYKTNFYQDIRQFSIPNQLLFGNSQPGWNIHLIFFGNNDQQQVIINTKHKTYRSILHGVKIISMVLY